MSNILIMKPTKAISSPGVTTAGDGEIFLYTPDPKEVYVADAATNPTRIIVDHGTNVSMNCALLGFTNLPAGASVDFRTGTTTTTTSRDVVTVPPTDLPLGRRHAFGQFAPQSARYLEARITAPAAPVEAGVLISGMSFVPTYNRDWGEGRQIFDTGDKVRNRAGGFGVAKGARGFRLTFTLAELTDAEVRTLEAMCYDRGNSEPAVIVENPADADIRQEYIHYGLFDRFTALERRNPDETKWRLSIDEWV